MLALDKAFEVVGFQLGRDQLIGEMRHRSRIALLTDWPSIGPRSADRGNQARRRSNRQPHTPSIGPRSADRGNDRPLQTGDANQMPSIGPRSADRGNGIAPLTK